MIPVPTEITNLDIAFGNIKHMPEMKNIPEEFKDRNGDHYKFISNWFFSGITETEMNRFKEKEGVNRTMALASIRAVMASFDPKHEHKISACAYMFSEWFGLKEEK